MPFPLCSNWISGTKLRVTAALVCGLFGSVASPADVSAEPVITLPLEEVLVQAAQANLPVLVVFIGTDWSVACMRMQRRIFQDPAFQNFATDRLIYFPVNARRTPKLDNRETALLQSLVIHFSIKSYPTVILLDPDGKERLRHGYRDLSAEEYVEILSALFD